MKFNCKKNTSLDLRLIVLAKHNFGGKVVYEKQTGENENENRVDWNEDDINYKIMKILLLNYY